MIKLFFLCCSNEQLKGKTAIFPKGDYRANRTGYNETQRQGQAGKNRDVCVKTDDDPKNKTRWAVYIKVTLRVVAEVTVPLGDLVLCCDDAQLADGILVMKLLDEVLQNLFGYGSLSENGSK